MVAPPEAIETRLHDLGAFIRDQRRNARLARGLQISAETLYVRAGILDDEARPADLVGAIERDDTISERQKQTLVDIYRSFQKEAGGGPGAGATSDPT